MTSDSASFDKVNRDKVDANVGVNHAWSDESGEYANASKSEYVRSRVMQSLKKRWLSAAVFPLLIGGVVALQSLQVAALTTLLAFAFSLVVLVIRAYHRHSERWNWWQTGGMRQQ